MIYCPVMGGLSVRVTSYDQTAQVETGKTYKEIKKKKFTAVIG